MTRMRSNTPNQSLRSQQQQQQQHPDARSISVSISNTHQQHSHHQYSHSYNSRLYPPQDQASLSNLTSANTSCQTSNASIYSMPFHSVSRRSTPPTPLPSPGLFRPPSRSGPAETPAAQYLHPSQYRQKAEPVRETHQLETDVDPMGRKTLNHYSIIDEIGRGTHGKVKLGYDMRTKELVAIKVVERSQGRPRLGRKGDGGEGSETKIRREIAILKKIRHENVVRLLEVIDDARSKKVYLVLEYVVRGEVVWRNPGDPDVIQRDRQRLKREVAAARTRLATVAVGGGGGEQKGEQHKHRKHRRKHTNMSFWSLEFASDSYPESDAEDEGDQSDTESIMSVADEDCYVPAMDIEEARRCFRDTVVGLDYLHWNGIVHRDIKPANLLWTDDKVTKISDFGVSFLGRPIRDEDDGTGEDEPTGYEQDEFELAKTSGTPAFFAPELCSIDTTVAKSPITSAIDVWALGVTLFCFIFGRPPFMADSEFKLFRCIAEEELAIPRRRLRAHKPELDHLHNLSPEDLEEYESEPVDEDLRDLISRLLTKNPSKRILLKEVKRHPWVLHGIKDPIGWVERTDPERTSHGNKIEVTTEDVETAVSVPGIVHRAKIAFRKFLKKRTSNAVHGTKEQKGKQGVVGSDTPANPSGSKQGQQKTFLNTISSSDKDDPDKELQWMGGMEEPREDEKLNTLAPSATNSSTGSSETVQAQRGNDHHEPELHSRQWSSSVTGNLWRPSPPADKTLRRKHSMTHLTPNILRRRSSQTNDPASAVRANHRSPTHAPPASPANDATPHMFKAESTAALVAPDISRRIVRTDGFGSAGRRRNPVDEDGNPLRARDILSDTLYPGNSGSEYDTLPTHTPQSRSLYLPVEGIENGLLNIFPKALSTNMKQKVERHRREEQEQARLRLGKADLDDLSDQPWPSPDDDASPQQLFSQENQRIMLEEEERHPCNFPSTSSLPFRTPEGWTHDSFYHPVRDWVTPPIAMAARNRAGYFDPPSPKSRPCGGLGLVSSSSDERFATTAGSSLTNSISFPSVATDPSSVSSDLFLDQFSRKGSHVVLDDNERLRMIQAQAHGRKISELFFQDVNEDSGSESEGGFVMGGKGPRRAKSIMVGELARKPDEAKDAAIRRASRSSRPRHYSRSSGGTVKSVLQQE